MEVQRLERDWKLKKRRVCEITLFLKDGKNNRDPSKTTVELFTWKIKTAKVPSCKN
jgi:hypothetical protein